MRVGFGSGAPRAREARPSAAPKLKKNGNPSMPENLDMTSAYVLTDFGGGSLEGMGVGWGWSDWKF